MPIHICFAAVAELVDPGSAMSSHKRKDTHKKKESHKRKETAAEKA